MTTNPTRLDTIYARINKEANKIAQEESGFYSDEDTLVPDPTKQVYHDQVRRYYKAGAEPYGEQLAAADDLIMEIVGVINDLIGIAYPSVPILKKAHNVLAKYNTYKQDEANKTDEDDNPNKQIIGLLIEAYFEETEKDCYANEYCSVCLDYNKVGETVIVNNHGGIMEQLPTNYYAILGWLLKSRMGSIKLLDH